MAFLRNLRLFFSIVAHSNTKKPLITTISNAFSRKSSFEKATNMTTSLTGSSSLSNSKKPASPIASHSPESPKRKAPTHQWLTRITNSRKILTSSRSGSDKRKCPRLKKRNRPFRTREGRGRSVLGWRVERTRISKAAKKEKMTAKSIDEYAVLASDES